MFRRLALTAATVAALLLVPLQAEHTRAASTPLCATAATVARVDTLPIQPVRSQPIRGIFCFTIQYTPGIGYTLPYEARIAGLRPTVPGLLQVRAALLPISTYANRLNIIAYVYQPSALLQAVARCGCIQPAGPPPPPHGPYVGIQSVTVLPNARGSADVTGMLSLAARP
jgi:hypothetical protein